MFDMSQKYIWHKFICQEVNEMIDEVWSKPLA